MGLNGGAYSTEQKYCVKSNSVQDFLKAKKFLYHTAPTANL